MAALGFAAPPGTLQLPAVAGALVPAAAPALRCPLYPRKQTSREHDLGQLVQVERQVCIGLGTIASSWARPGTSRLRRPPQCPLWDMSIRHDSDLT